MTSAQGFDGKVRVSSDDECASLNERLLRQIAETIEDGFYLREHASGSLSYVSPAFGKIFGHSRQEFYRCPDLVLGLAHEEDRKIVECIREAAMRGEACDEEYRIIRPDGELRWIRERAFLVDGTEGGVERIAGIAQDVTEQRLMDIEIRQRQKMEAIGQLASGVAHDFNNILMGIHGCASIGLSKIGDSTDVRPFLEAIRQSSESGTAIIKQLLAFSSNRHIEVATFDLGELVEDDETMLARLLGDSIHLSIQRSNEPCLVRMGSGQLEQVLMNLAINARDAMPEGGELVIETERGQEMPMGDGRVALGPCAILRVSDTGSGMSEDVRERIFEPFFTTKGIGEGTGLGLSTVYGIVKDARGSVRCESALGRGTTFIVYLPLIDHEASLSTEEERRSVRYELVPDRVGCRALLVEDESTVRMATRLYLESAGFEVVESRSGIDAAELLEVEATSFDLLVTDVGLPGLGGYGLALKARALVSSIPIVFMSAHPEEWLVEKGRLAHGELTLQKPFSKRELLGMVEVALQYGAERNE